MADIEFHRYVRLVVDEPLSDADRKTFYKVVKDNAPSGVVTTTMGIDDENKPQPVAMIAHSKGKKTDYDIGVMRDLNENEVSAIVVELSKKFDFDFDVETNVITRRIDSPPIDIEGPRHAAICLAAAKRQHDIWLKEREKSGWRFATTFSEDEKTHPLIRPWEQLPDRFKKVDYDLPQEIINMLIASGYNITAGQ